MLVKNRSLVVLAALGAAVLCVGCASRRAPNPALVPAAGHSMTLQEAAQLTGEAEQLVAERRLPEASTRYVRVVTAYPDNAQAWFRLGNVYLRGSQFGYAQRAFEQTLRADPQLTKAQANLALVHLYLFRVAANQAIVSDQVPEEKRKVFASLVRDVDHAITPGGASPAAAP
jgi:cytochrome c-type biogenesis protein CcmH/NrfG